MYMCIYIAIIYIDSYIIYIYIYVIKYKSPMRFISHTYNN